MNNCDMMNAFLYGSYRTRSLSEIFPDYGSFNEEFDDTPFSNSVDDKHLKLTYYLLYANYGNSHVANSDENQFKFKLFSIIFQYGPAWEKKLEIQEKIKLLKEEEIVRGSQTIYNQAAHPGTTPVATTEEIIQGIDSQDVTNYKRSKLDAYATQYDMIDDTITRNYIAKFKDLFLKIVQPELPLWYKSEE